MIEIRKFTQSDAATVFAYSGSFENTYYMLASPNRDIGETEDYITRCIKEYNETDPRYLAFAVTDDGDHVGEVFATFEECGVIIGWIIRTDRQGRGIATEAASQLIRYLRDERGVKKIISFCDSRNTASRRVMEKLGLVFIGESGERHYKKDVSDGVELQFELKYDK